MRDQTYLPDTSLPPCAHQSSGHPEFKPPLPHSRNQVTCLSVSTDGSLLLSGSHDETVRLWDIQSKQCLKTMNHKGRHALISDPLLPSCRRPLAPGS